VIAIGIGIAWAGYAGIFWSYCLIKGYNVSFTQMFTTAIPKWPPSQMTPDMIFPTGVDSSASGSSTDSSGQPTVAAGNDTQLQQAIANTGKALSTQGTPIR
jgi:hypothetical protein